MKEQQFADLRDYMKYSFLRQLLEHDLGCTVCWMMTPYDRTTPTPKTRYVRDRQKWGHYDPAVFEYLREQVNNGQPDIRSLQREDVSPIAACRFYWRRFPPSSTRRMDEHFTFRKSYFDGCLHEAIGTDLVFLDPDTGLENDSLKLKDLDKYVLWDEISRIYHAGHSVMVFNFLRGGTDRKDNIVAERTELLRERLRNADVLRTHDLAFFFAGAG